MGGDHAPRAEVEGAVLAARELGVRVLLVGHRSRRSGRSWTGTSIGDLPIEIVNADRRDHDDGFAVARVSPQEGKLAARGRAAGPRRQGRRAGQRRQHRRGDDRGALRDRHAAFGGPSGAGLRRFPNMKEKVSVILDVGANVDSKPAQIEQFAVMGEIYYRAIWGVKRPRVALLSIGEEETKGNELTREAASLLKQTLAEFRRQRGRARRFSRQRGRDRLRRIHRQHRAEAQRGTGRADRRHAEEGDQEQPRDRRSAMRFRRARSTNSASAPIIPNMAARRCWAFAASPSSATAGRMRTPSRTPSASPPSFAASRVNEKIEQELSAAAAVAARG